MLRDGHLDPVLLEETASERLGILMGNRNGDHLAQVTVAGDGVQSPARSKGVQGAQGLRATAGTNGGSVVPLLELDGRR